MSALSPIYLGKLEIINPVFLAPMDGYTDFPFRSICKQLGAGVVLSEFINGVDIANGHPFLPQKVYFSELERPFGFQIFDDSPERLLQAAQYLQEFDPDFIDINFGCSAKNVSNRGAGAGLLKDPEKIATIIRLLVKQIQKPITAKIRLGWDENNLNYLQIAQIIEQEGAQMISIHGRTKTQGYSGKANWNAIAEIQARLRIPVIANGDIRTPEDIENVVQITACQGVMIGRGALSNPWIFQNKHLDDVSTVERFAVFQTHLESILHFYGHRSGMILFRKHLHSYINTEKLHREQRVELFTQNDPAKLKALANNYIFFEEFIPLGDFHF